MWVHEHFIGQPTFGSVRTLVTLRAVAAHKFSSTTLIAQVSQEMVAAAADMTDFAATGGDPVLYVQDGRLVVSIGVYLSTPRPTTGGRWIDGWRVSTPD